MTAPAPDTLERDRARFDELSKAIEVAQSECHRTYIPWNDACDRLHALERERSMVWNRMVDGLIR